MHDLTDDGSVSRILMHRVTADGDGDVIQSVRCVFQHDDSGDAVARRVSAAYVHLVLRRLQAGLDLEVSRLCRTFID